MAHLNRNNSFPFFGLSVNPAIRGPQVVSQAASTPWQRLLELLPFFRFFLRLGSPMVRDNRPSLFSVPSVFPQKTLTIPKLPPRILAPWFVVLLPFFRFSPPSGREPCFLIWTSDLPPQLRKIFVRSRLYEHAGLVCPNLHFFLFVYHFLRGIFFARLSEKAPDTWPKHAHSFPQQPPLPAPD